MKRVLLQRRAYLLYVICVENIYKYLMKELKFIGVDSISQKFAMQVELLVAFNSLNMKKSLGLRIWNRPNHIP